MRIRTRISRLLIRAAYYLDPQAAMTLRTIGNVAQDLESGRWPRWKIHPLGGARITLTPASSPSDRLREVVEYFGLPRAGLGTADVGSRNSDFQWDRGPFETMA